MSDVEEILGDFLKPEVKKQGSDLAAKGLIVVTQATDTQVGSYSKGSSPARVTLQSRSIEDDTIFADCNCPVASKGRFCKHIWGTILLAYAKNPDFFESKTSLEKMERSDSLKQESSSAHASERLSLKTPLKSPPKPEQTEYKAKQDAYRKQQYEKQKLRMKEQKADRKQKEKQGKQRSNKTNPQPSALYPAHIEKAIAYFSENGFPMENGIDAEVLKTAKRVLSRIFHPDKGGTHEEALELNRNFELLMSYLNT